jgi:transcriptional regulator with XRE-family HTH domain
MINSQNFTKRLEKVMQYHGLSSSAFAEKIGVQRSSISHILSGRNKPSLDFVMKILSSFPDIDLYWLLNGKGEFPDKGQNTDKNQENINLTKIKSIQGIDSGKSIKRIVIFYSDGSFENFES